MRSKKTLEKTAERLLFALEETPDIEKARKALTWRKAIGWALGLGSIELELLLKGVAE